MKTYACPKCGRRMSFDGIVRGGGVMSIWRDGKEVWSGTGLEAVAVLQKIITTGANGFVTCESSPDEKQVVAKFQTLEECQAFYRALAFAAGR